MRFLYSLAWWLALPALLLTILWRAVLRPSYRANWLERFGVYQHTPTGAHLVFWIHAVSVGETRAAQPLVLALLAAHPTGQILLTHMTPTGRKAGADLYEKFIVGKRLRQAYLPYDYGFAMQRFMAYWRPQLGVVMETEVWPNLMAVAKRNALPIALVNARLSAKSLKKGLRFKSLMSQAVERFDVIVAQSEQDAERISSFAPLKSISVSGNIKFDVKADPEKIALGLRWRSLVGRPVLLLASSRDGEEQMFFDALNDYSNTCKASGHEAFNKDILFLVVPRHPERFEAVRLLALKAGFSVANRSAQMPAANTQVWLGDSMGEMFSYYSMATVALLGGSFGPFGSQNLLEAMAVGCPVVVGPSRFNFDHVISDALLAGGATSASSMADAVSKAGTLLASPDILVKAGAAGTRFCATHQGATTKTMRLLEPLISKAHRLGKS
jgi:3-deoxy-D-manno-octulosonic-acid transferase